VGSPPYGTGRQQIEAYDVRVCLPHADSCRSRIYNMIAYLMDMDFHQTVFQLCRLFGHQSRLSTGDILVLLGVILLT